jgi:hypothetical protein
MTLPRKDIPAIDQTTINKFLLFDADRIDQLRAVILSRVYIEHIRESALGMTFAVSSR